MLINQYTQLLLLSTSFVTVLEQIQFSNENMDIIYDYKFINGSMIFF